LVRITLPLTDVFVGAREETEWSGIAADEAASFIEELYAFLGPDVSVTVQGDTVTIQADVEGTADKRAARLLDKAAAEANRGRYPRAVGLFERFLERVPGGGDARRDLGMAHLEMGEVEAAERHVIEALRLDPKDPWSLVLLGNIYLQHKEDPEVAEALYKKAIAVSPQDPHLLSNLGSLYARQGDEAHARAYFQRAIEADPSFPNAYYNLAVLDNEAGEPEAVVETLDAMLTQAESMDLRSDPVYENARQLYQKATTEIAGVEYETLMEYVRGRRAELEGESGVEIELVHV
jgi:Flp pilus assembly protein TadD